MLMSLVNITDLNTLKTHESHTDFSNRSTGTFHSFYLQVKIPLHTNPHHFNFQPYLKETQFIFHFCHHLVLLYLNSHARHLYLRLYFKNGKVCFLLS